MAVAQAWAGVLREQPHREPAQPPSQLLTLGGWRDPVRAPQPANYSRTGECGYDDIWDYFCREPGLGALVEVKWQGEGVVGWGAGPVSPTLLTGADGPITPCSWDRKNNPEPWNKLSPTDQYKVSIG